MIHNANVHHHPLRSRLLRAAAVLGLVAPLAAVLPVSASDDSPSTTGPPAVFETPATAFLDGEEIDLSEDWGEARACAVTDTGVICFRSVAELEAHERTVALRSGRSTSCAAPLRLYSGRQRSGRVLSISARGRWVNLSSYGFDNVTSSYRTGSCSVTLASGSFGNGGHYPGCTRAHCSVSAMARGWDNVISSVINR